MQQHDPYGDKYGRHSNFRPERGEPSPTSPITKLFFVVVAVAVAVLAYDRLRAKWNQTPTPVASTTSSQGGKNDLPSTVADDAAPVAAEISDDEALPDDAAIGPAAPAVQPQPIASLSPAEAAKAEASPQSDIARYEMQMTRGNSFMGLGTVNGKAVTFLADTGASTVVVPEKTAARLGLKKGSSIAFNTGGGVVPHYATVIKSMTLGDIELQNVQAAINPAMRDEFILLGMSALGMLDMQQEKGKLVLTHKQIRAYGGDLRTVEEEKFTRSVKDCASRKGNKFDKQTLDCLRGN